jgi:hypothetical protein
MSDPGESFRAAVLAALGNAPEHITPGEFQRFATNGKRSDQSGWCKLFADGRAGVFGCMRQGISDMWTSQVRRFMSPVDRIELARQMGQAQRLREAHQRQQWQHNAERNARLWAACRPLTPGDPVARYLAQRLRAQAAPLPGALRLHPGLDYWHEGQRLGTHPAMVGALTSRTGELMALHRTYLTDDGRKADVPTAKKLTGASGLVLGGCIALGEPNEGGALGIAEGIETALAASQASGLPVCAAYSAGALAAWKWPAGVRHLVILADADKAGEDAADELRKRARAHALRVTVMTPTAPGADWCDVWAARAPGAPDFVPAMTMEVTP